MPYTNNISRRKFIYGASCSICSSLILPSCAEVPFTNRKQLNFYKYNVPIILPGQGIGGLPMIFANENHLNKEIEKQYRKFVADAKTRNILIENTNESKKIKEIGKEIYKSIEKYYKNNNEVNPVNSFDWEFALIDAKDSNGNLIKNAWCMPGGKIAFYTGIMPIAKNDDGIASIMGHEIAHAFARHTVEKLTQYSIVSMGTQGLLASKYGNVLAQNSDIYNNIVQFGIMLPFSRTMESEADFMGLVFMNLSGFNMQESIKVWQRMQSSSQGSLPQFMNSHPSPENRINKIKESIPKINEQFPTLLI